LETEKRTIQSGKKGHEEGWYLRRGEDRKWRTFSVDGGGGKKYGKDKTLGEKGFTSFLIIKILGKKGRGGSTSLAEHPGSPREYLGRNGGGGDLHKRRLSKQKTHTEEGGTVSRRGSEQHRVAEEKLN